MRRFSGIVLLFVCAIGSAQAQMTHNVTDQASFFNALRDVTLNPAVNHVININQTFTMTGDVPPISVDVGQTVTINGNNNAIDGADAFRPFFVHQGTVTISNLTIDNGGAIGGNGSGGGMGAGGALFVDKAAIVNISNVSFASSLAQGGQGGNVNSDVGGGGLGGNGGSGGGGGLYGKGGTSGGGGGALGNGGDNGGGGGGFLGDGGSNAGAGGGLTSDASGSTPGDNGGAPGQPSQGRGGGGGGATSIDSAVGGSGEPGGGQFGGGGGGAAGTTVAGTGGSGGTFGGGGFGGSTVGSSAVGGNGGDFGGGGSGLIVSNGTGTTKGGDGGFGGGGGSARVASGGLSATGGNGGFGGGGGVAFGSATTLTHGTGGFGGGNGSTTGGGGGAAFGGAIFVREGGQLNIMGSGTMAGGTVTGGTGAGAGGNGTAAGTGLFLQNAGVNFQIDGTDAFTISDTIADSTGFMTDAGSLTKTGTGTLTLSGNNTYTGNTNVNGGLLNINGDTSTSNFLVNNGGILGGTGSVGTTTVNAGGTVAPGTGVGSLNVTGTYTQQANSFYAVEIVDDGTSDLIAVTGNAQLNGGTVNVTSAPGNYQAGQTFTILTATAGVTGQFAGATDDLAFLTAVLIHNPNDVMLQLVRNQTAFADVALTPNQQAVANNLDMQPITGDLGVVITQILNLNTSQAQTAFASLSGEVHGSVGTMQLQVSENFLHHASNHLYNLMNVSNSGPTGFAATNTNNPMIVRGSMPDETSGDIQLVSVKSDAPTMVSEPMCCPVEHHCTTFAGWTGWTSGYGLAGAVEGDGNARGYGYTIAGTMFGLDRHINESTSISVIGGYANSLLNGNDGRDGAEADSVQFALGGVWNPGAFYALATVGYSHDEFDTSRQILLGPVRRQASGDYSGNEFLSYYEAGLLANLGCWQLSPLASLQYIHLQTNAFTETGAGAAGLAVADQTTDSLRAGAGLRLSRPIHTDRGLSVTPELTGRWYHECLTNDRGVVGTFGGSAAGPFVANGAALGRDFGELGTKLRLASNSRLSLALGYDLQLTDHHVAHQGSGNVTVTW